MNRMESLKQKLSNDLKTALKSGDSTRLSTLRMLSAAIANKEIELRKKDIGLSDEEVLEAISSEARRRKDSSCGADDLKERRVRCLRSTRSPPRARRALMLAS